MTMRIQPDFAELARYRFRCILPRSPCGTSARTQRYFSIQTTERYLGCKQRMRSQSNLLPSGISPLKNSGILLQPDIGTARYDSPSMLADAISAAEERVLRRSQESLF